MLHYGSLPGAYTLLVLVPDLQLGIFLSHNGAIQRDPYTINALILTHLLDIALGLPSWISDFERDACNFPTSIHFKPVNPAPSHQNASDFARTRHQVHTYVGIYEHPVLGKVKVRHEQRRLRLSYGLIDSDLLPQQNTSTTEDAERFLALPRKSGWVQLIDHFTVLFFVLDSTDQGARVFCHLGVPLLNDIDDSVFTRVRQVHDLGVDNSPFSDPSSSAQRRNCLSRWHPFAMLLVLLLLLLQTKPS